MAGKAFLVRAGGFKDVDVTLYSHVSNNFMMMDGPSPCVAIVSAELKFKGQSAHAAGAPWRGKSALDAALLMGTAWEYTREHREHLALLPRVRTTTGRWSCSRRPSGSRPARR